MIRNISESVILPIAGMVLTFIACYELIQMLIEHNNLANFETVSYTHLDVYKRQGKSSLPTEA